MSRHRLSTFSLLAKRIGLYLHPPNPPVGGEGGVGVLYRVHTCIRSVLLTLTSLYGVTRHNFALQIWAGTSHGIVHMYMYRYIIPYGVHRYKPIFCFSSSAYFSKNRYDITVIAPRYVKVPNRAVDMDSRALPACYPRGNF